MSLNLLLALGVIAIANGVVLVHEGEGLFLHFMGCVLIFVGSMSLAWFREGVDR